jgi:hypothetical protein
VTGEYGSVIKTTDEEIQNLAKNERFVHFAGSVIPPRPGVRLFAAKLEYSYFEPGTPRNDEFILHVINWQGMSWAVVSIPREYMEAAKKIAAEVGLRIADGVPHLIVGGQTHPFPMNTENVFALENVPGHEIYENNPNRLAELLAKEDHEVEEIERGHKSSRRN